MTRPPPRVPVWIRRYNCAARASYCAAGVQTIWRRCCVTPMILRCDADSATAVHIRICAPTAKAFLTGRERSAAGHRDRWEGLRRQRRQSWSGRTLPQCRARLLAGMRVLNQVDDPHRRSVCGLVDGALRAVARESECAGSPSGLGHGAAMASLSKAGCARPFMKPDRLHDLRMSARVAAHWVATAGR